MNTRSPTECPAWARLLAQAESTRTVHLRDLFASRKLVAEAAGVRYDFSRQRVDAMTLRLLADLAGERGFPEWRTTPGPIGAAGPWKFNTQRAAKQQSWFRMIFCKVPGSVVPQSKRKLPLRAPPMVVWGA